jgi:hypothetical protein
MIEKKCAIEMQTAALNAITELTNLLNMSKGHCSLDEYEKIKEGVGRSIGDIQMGILEVIIAEFPELDDLTK